MSANATRTSMSMAPSDGGVLHQMWIPCVVFAHMFAGYFLLRMLTVMYPKAWADIKRKLFCRGSLKDQQVHAAKGEYHVAPGLVNIWAKFVECRVGFYNMHKPSECRDQAVPLLLASNSTILRHANSAESSYNSHSCASRCQDYLVYAKASF